MTEAEAASESAGERAHQIVARWAEVYERTAWALDHSAALAEMHAQRHAQAGQTNAAEDEHITAQWARKAAQRARGAADRARESADRARSPAVGRSAPTADPER